MLSFADFYMLEKTINVNKKNQILNNVDKSCILIGHKLAKRFDLILNGWMEMYYVFTIPSGVPDEKNTLMAKNEQELVNKLNERFPNYLKYIMDKNFPNGYEPDKSIPSKPPIECEPMNLDDFKRSLLKNKENE